MSYRTVAFVEQEFYHVYNRGTDKRIIFLDNGDYDRFQSLLYLSNSAKPINVRDIKRLDQLYSFERGEALVAIGAYCQMPNHFHILLTPLVADGVSLYMRKLCTSYAMYFNKKYERNGSLFQGKFKAKHADSDEYLKYLFSYIHLNPTKLFYVGENINTKEVIEELFTQVASYSHSSLADYFNAARIEKDIIAPQYFPEYFIKSKDLKNELLTWLNNYENKSPLGPS